MSNLRPLLDGSQTASVEMLEKHIIQYYTDGKILLTADDVAAIAEMAEEFEDLGIETRK